MPAKQSPKTETKTETKTAPAKSRVAAATPVVEQVVTAAAPAVATAPAVTEKKRQTRKTEAAPVEQAPVAQAAAETVATEEQEQAKEKVVPTPETVHADFAELITELEQQIAQLRDSSDKGSVKYLRGVLRRVKNLQSSCSRVLRRKQPTKRVNNNSGFLKPVQISPEIAKFTSLDPASLHSRVDVTKRVCDYIKQHNLQNPEDKRQIVADPALSKILGYDAKKDQPLTYYRIQTLLKNHFVKDQQ